jgi:hypothetical protein
VQLVDLCTEVGQPLQSHSRNVAILQNVYNTMFINDKILLKYCTKPTNALFCGNLGDFLKAYSQSYPQNLWVSIFSLFGNELSGYSKVKSSSHRQAIERS